jgi:F0F1-type ATP synthase membrane subunit c/vacuolar-type H+-ATPase subunit K
MDPLTLFALANGAVSAVKAGCKLYKDIKGAAGDVKDVLKDLENQFHKLHPPEKPPTVAQKNAYIEEKNRVITLNKRANAEEHTGLYQEIGEHLGTYYDNLHKCMAIFAEEERRAKTEVYTGDDSVGKRALKRVLMRKQLEQMGTELREIMVYQSPKELGALWTEVEEMMVVVGKEQQILITKQIQMQAVQDRRRAARRKQATRQMITGIGIIVVIFFYGFIMMLVAQSRQEMYPQYGKEFFPKTEEQRKRDAAPQIYIGR